MRSITFLLLAVPFSEALSGSKMSVAIPFLERPKVLDQVSLAGDVGFDPLNLAGNVDNLLSMREAEIKHARLAMLAAAGWPLSELLDRKIASALNLAPVLDAADRAPSLLNGGLEKISPLWWGFCIGLTAAIDLYGVRRARFAPDYLPGDLGFDPFGFYPSEENIKGREAMQLAEIKHGRLAMIAVTGYGIQEGVLKEGVIDETPFFFTPITKTLEGYIEQYLQ